MAHSLPQDTMIESVTLIVRDRDRSLAFYRDLLGFNVTQDDGSRIALAPADDNPILYLDVRPDAIPKPPRSIGLYHVAILMPDRAWLGAVLQRLIAAAYRLQGASDHGVSEALYLADPDGNGLEIYRDRPRDQWNFVGADVAMVTEPMDVEGVLRDAYDTFDAMPAETIIGHVHLHVSDLQDAERFYCDALGFDVTQRSYPGALFISAGGYHHHIGLNTWAGKMKPPENAVGLARMTIRIPGGLDGVIDSLSASGVPVERDGDAAFVRDMDGNQLQLLS